MSWVRQTTTRYETKLNRELDNTLKVNRSAFDVVITNLSRYENYDLKSQVCLGCTTCNDSDEVGTLGKWVKVGWKLQCLVWRNPAFLSED